MNWQLDRYTSSKMSHALNTHLVEWYLCCVGQLPIIDKDVEREEKYNFLDEGALRLN